MIALVSLVFSSSVAFVPVAPTLARSDDRLTIYELAEAVTGAPADILHGIACAESGEDDEAVGDQGRSLGRFQINEDFRAERVRKWGEYDPHDPREAAIIAGRIYVENLSRLSGETLAICSYRQGVQGVIDHGATEWYSERVRGNL